MKYIPHDYQTYATKFIEEHPVAAVLLDMGLGKSVITLTAIKNLCLDAFEVQKILVIAPLRVRCMGTARVYMMKEDCYLYKRVVEMNTLNVKVLI